MKTWEVLLDTQGNGLIPRTITADDYEVADKGVSFVTENEDHSYSDVAFFPFTKLAGGRQLSVTP